MVVSIYSKGKKYYGRDADEARKKVEADESGRIQDLRKKKGSGEDLTKSEEFDLKFAAQEEARQARKDISALEEKEREGKITKVQLEKSKQNVVKEFALKQAGYNVEVYPSGKKYVVQVMQPARDAQGKTDLDRIVEERKKRSPVTKTMEVTPVMKSAPAQRQTVQERPTLFSILPSQGLTKDNLGEQVQLKSAFPVLSALAQATGKPTEYKKPRYTVSRVQQNTSLLGITVSSQEKEVIIPLEPGLLPSFGPGKGGEYHQYQPEGKIDPSIKPEIKQIIITPRIGTNEEIIGYSTGKTERLTVNPIAELVRQGGSVSYERDRFGRPQVTSITPGPNAKVTRDSSGKIMSIEIIPKTLIENERPIMHAEDRKRGYFEDLYREGQTELTRASQQRIRGEAVPAYFSEASGRIKSVIYYAADTARQPLPWIVAAGGTLLLSKSPALAVEAGAISTAVFYGSSLYGISQGVEPEKYVGEAIAYMGIGFTTAKAFQAVNSLKELSNVKFTGEKAVTKSFFNQDGSVSESMGGTRVLSKNKDLVITAKLNSKTPSTFGEYSLTKGSGSYKVTEITKTYQKISMDPEQYALKLAAEGKIEYDPAAKATEFLYNKGERYGEILGQFQMVRGRTITPKIKILEGISPQQKALTLKHELYHYQDYASGKTQSDDVYSELWTDFKALFTKNFQYTQPGGIRTKTVDVGTVEFFGSGQNNVKINKVTLNSNSGQSMTFYEETLLKPTQTGSESLSFSYQNLPGKSNGISRAITENILVKPVQTESGQVLGLESRDYTSGFGMKANDWINKVYTLELVNQAKANPLSSMSLNVNKGSGSGSTVSSTVLNQDTGNQNLVLNVAQQIGLKQIKASQGPGSVFAVPALSTSSYPVLESESQQQAKSVVLSLSGLSIPKARREPVAIADVFMKTQAQYSSNVMVMPTSVPVSLPRSRSGSSPIGTVSPAVGQITQPVQDQITVPVSPVPGFIPTRMSQSMTEPAEGYLGLPQLDIRLFGSRARSRSRKVSQETEYRPSLDALAFGITGPMPKVITPFQTRPMISRGRKRR